MSQLSPEGIILGKGSKLVSLDLSINEEKVFTTMSPEEKAKELYEKYIWIAYSTDKYHAKKCATIAVNEILDKDGYNNDFWKEVKAEIEKI